MGFILIIITSSFLAQAEPAATDEMPYALELRSTGEWIYGFLDEGELEDPRVPQIRVELDAPWLDSEQARRTIRKSDIANSYEEVEGGRKRRLEQGWKDAGYRLTETATGADWVLVKEIELATRAHEMEARSLVSLDEEDGGEPELEGIVQTEGPSFFAQWGLHMAVLGAAVLLSGLIIAIGWL